MLKFGRQDVHALALSTHRQHEAGLHAPEPAVPQTLALLIVTNDARSVRLCSCQNPSEWYSSWHMMIWKFPLKMLMICVPPCSPRGELLKLLFWKRMRLVSEPVAGRNVTPARDAMAFM